MLSTPSVEDRKHSDSLLTSFERKAVAHLLEHVPLWVRPEHLTLLTLFWSALVLLASALAKGDRRWLWALSLLIACQYVTDAIDGKVGKLRNAGLVRWGYYMDHLLDYGFLCAILLGYTILLPAESQYLMTAVLAVCGGFMVSSFLARSVTGVLAISYFKIGPIEIRLVFMGINAWLATAGNASMLRVVPYVIGASLAVLVAMVFEIQRTLWHADRVERCAIGTLRHAVPDRANHADLATSADPRVPRDPRPESV